MSNKEEINKLWERMGDYSNWFYEIRRDTEFGIDQVRNDVSVLSTTTERLISIVDRLTTALQETKNVNNEMIAEIGAINVSLDDLERRVNSTEDAVAEEDDEDWSQYFSVPVQTETETDNEEDEVMSNQEVADLTEEEKVAITEMFKQVFGIDLAEEEKAEVFENLESEVEEAVEADSSDDDDPFIDFDPELSDDLMQWLEENNDMIMGYRNLVGSLAMARVTALFDSGLTTDQKVAMYDGTTNAIMDIEEKLFNAMKEGLGEPDRETMMKLAF